MSMDNPRISPYYVTLSRIADFMGPNLWKQHEKAIEDCTKALELNPNYLKALLRRAEMYEKTEKLDEALEDYKKVIEMDPTQHTAREACIRLPQQITERNEKMKDEMMGKLKELGNMVLKPFGMSTDNFKLHQDPSTSFPCICPVRRSCN
ncbi:tetratricopeptide repeat protein 1-like [Lingula anatina]|uniref:Tetratricopeptide repeat protein 1-like n=1 Tax=Lingula anatina TaxID=7574 RepID=A0A1S3KF36_LINAN|nr:tetratricopeptide repeat protein 1-like [Lingula anatina]|eukprot:XP_013421248.1 tetratricopeptide repeat protein 1-like [Lingula anatina]